MSVYPTNITFIKDGEPVTGTVASRPDKQLAARTDSLKSRMEAAAAGQAVILYDMPIESACEVGMPVYWNEEYSWFSPAYACAEVGCDTGSYQLTKPSDVLGLLYEKNSNTSGSILMFGVVNFPAIRNYIEEGTGRFYLGGTAGTLVKDPPVVEVPVGSILGPKDDCDTGCYVFVNPEFARRHFNHQHFRHYLHTSTNSWDPAGDDAPTGAVYKYRLDDELKKVFPPIPVYAYSFYIAWNTDETPGLKQVDDSIIKLTNTGIWWMSSDEEPFASSNDSGPREFVIELNYSRIVYPTKESIVTTLQPSENAPLKFVNCEGEVANAGDLYASLDLDETEYPVTNYNGRALKHFTSDLKQQTTPVLHGIAPGNGNVVIQGTSEFLDDATKYYNGLIKIAVNTYSVDYELSPQVVKLENAQETTWQSIPCISFPATRASSILIKMEVPGVFGDSLKLKLRTLLLAPVAGTLTGLSAEYMRIPRPALPNVSESTAEWLGFSPVSYLTSALGVTRASVIELETDEITVNEGDTLIFRLSRSAATGYNSNIGIVRMNGILNLEV